MVIIVVEGGGSDGSGRCCFAIKILLAQAVVVAVAVVEV